LFVFPGVTAAAKVSKFEAKLNNHLKQHLNIKINNKRKDSRRFPKFAVVHKSFSDVSAGPAPGRAAKLRK
jgi:hypothetical protein